MKRIINFLLVLFILAFVVDAAADWPGEPNDHSWDGSWTPSPAELVFPPGYPGLFDETYNDGHLVYGEPSPILPPGNWDGPYGIELHYWNNYSNSLFGDFNMLTDSNGNPFGWRFMPINPVSCELVAGVETFHGSSGTDIWDIAPEGSFHSTGNPTYGPPFNLGDGPDMFRFKYGWSGAITIGSSLTGHENDNDLMIAGGDIPGQVNDIMTFGIVTGPGDDLVFVNNMERAVIDLGNGDGGRTDTIDPNDGDDIAVFGGLFRDNRIIGGAGDDIFVWNMDEHYQENPNGEWIGGPAFGCGAWDPAVWGCDDNDRLVLNIPDDTELLNAVFPNRLNGLPVQNGRICVGVRSDFDGENHIDTPTENDLYARYYYLPGYGPNNELPLTFHYRSASGHVNSAWVEFIAIEELQIGTGPNAKVYDVDLFTAAVTHNPSKTPYYIDEIPSRADYNNLMDTFASTPPIPDFEADITDVANCAGELTKVYFTDLSIQSPTSWQWEFNPATVTYVNGTSATSQHPVVQFTAIGNYTVYLTASNSFGSNTEMKPDYISVTQGRLLPYSQNFEMFTVPAIPGDLHAYGPHSWDLSEGWLNLENGVYDDTDWLPHSGSTITGWTGPTGDYDTGNGIYLYIESTGAGNHNNTAIVLSPCIDLTSAVNAELSFAYHMYGYWMEPLHVDIFSNGTWISDLFYTAGNQGESWHLVNVDLVDYLGQTIQIAFRGNTGADELADVAIDAVNITGVTTSNQPPQAANDTKTTVEDTDLVFPATDLLANDSDPENADLTVTAVSNPTNGSVNLSSGIITFSPESDFFGEAGFDYTITDGELNDLGHVSVTVTPVDDPPLAVDDDISIDEDTPLTFPSSDLTSNDIEVDNDLLTVTNVLSPVFCTVTLEGGLITFTPAVNHNGLSGFDYVVSDGGLTDVGHVTVSVNAVEDPPTAQDDNRETPEDTDLVFPAADLTVNDSDPENDPLTVTQVSNATNGTVNLTSGIITFSPDNNYFGLAGFDYTISDGQLTDLGHVTVTVTAVEDPPLAVDDDKSTDENTALIFPASDLTANDTDVDGDLLTVTDVHTSVNGVVLLESGAITFTPNENFNGTAGFDYVVSDGSLTDIGHVTVDVSDVQNPPEAQDDNRETPEDIDLVFPATDLIVNDNDPDNDDLTVTGVSAPTNGTVSLVSGMITFSPEPDFFGQAGFDYTVSDGQLTDTGHVTVTVTAVDDPPVAVDDNKSTDEDTPLTFPASDLTANDIDVDGDMLTVDAVQNPVNGSIVLEDGTITFTPDENFGGEAGFDYVVSDGSLMDTGHVIIDVSNIPDPPVAQDDNRETPEDTDLIFPAAELTANDSDPENDPLTVIQVSNATNGTVNLASGTITFSPDNNFFGLAGFDYTISDSQERATDEGHVVVNVTPVNDTPLANNDDKSTTEDVPLTFPASDLTVNDYDVDGDLLTVDGVQTPVNGTVVLEDGTITFTPDENFVGEAGFDYVLSDGQLTDVGHVTVNVGDVDDPPQAQDDNRETPEDVDLVFPAAELTANDTDPENDPLTVIQVSNPTNGTVNLANGTITFNPNNNFFGLAGFDYTISDGQLTDTGHVVVNVTPVNDQPLANNDDKSTNEDVPLTFPASDLTDNDTDVEDDQLTVTIVQNPINGVVILANNDITFSPTDDFNGLAGFEYTVSDGQLTDVGYVTVTVTAVNDAPVAVDDSTAITANVPYNLPTDELTANDTDVDGDQLSVTAVYNPENGTVVLDNNTITFTPTQDFGGLAGFDYTVSDGQDRATDEGHVILLVIANNPPIAIDDTRETAEDNDLLFPAAELVINDSDPDNDDLIVTIVSNPSHGTVDLSAGNITFSPEPDYFGQAGFEYTVSDGEMDDQGYVFITVTPINDAPVAVDDETSTIEDTQLTFPAADLVVNDTDVENDPLNVSEVQAAANGAVVLEDGIIIFSPSINFSGPAGFEYVVNDGDLTDTGHVTVEVISVEEPPTAQDDSFETLEDNDLVLLEAELIANDSDPDNDQLVVTEVTNPTNGTVDLSAGTITFGPAADYFGQAGFDYTVSDGQLTDEGHVVITITSVNDPPFAVDDSISIAAGIARTFPADNLTVNDIDVDGDQLTVTAVYDPENGTVSLENGAVTFTPDEDFAGIAGFDYTLSDGQTRAVDEGHVLLFVTENNPPIALDDSRETAEDTDLVFPAIELTENDTDLETDTLLVIAVSEPLNGTVSLFEGTITFSPEDNFYGPAGFNYTVSDGQLTDQGYVTVTVTPVNDAPEFGEIPEIVIVSGESNTVNFSDYIVDIDTPSSELVLEIFGNNQIDVDIDLLEVIFNGLNQSSEGYTEYLTAQVSDGEYTDYTTFAATILPRGDINGDGTINVGDVIDLIKLLLGFIQNPDETTLALADLNNDNRINIIDIIILITILYNNAN
ncbi:MAG: tandem-95 repeat protein [Planctomycetes bacterium]|nr:tandem-95 repeat protein [Planctomycetota bacterium]